MGIGMQMAIDGNTISTLITIGGPVGSAVLLGWWLSGRFRAIEERQRDQLDQLAKEGREHLDAHEEKDHERHEENLERFRTLSVSLAQLGGTNGSARAR